MSLFSIIRDWWSRTHTAVAPPKSNSFEDSLAEVLKWEGGWSDNPSDPGGATMKGITIGTYSRWMDRPVSKTELFNIPDTHVQRIYRDLYWNLIRGDDLPAGVNTFVFDFAVNSGPRRAAQYLQQIVGAETDGVIGPKTIAAVRKWDPISLINALAQARMNFLKRLKTWPVFGRGWTRRVSGVMSTAIQLARQ